jgi:hypothetical protein
MGDSFNSANTKVDQASASDILGDDAGRPKPATVGKAYVLEQVSEFSQGYEETRDAHTELESPTLFITISYVFASARREVKVPWHNGLTVQHAFKKARNRDALFRHVSVFSFMKSVNGRKVKLAHALHAGETLLLSIAGRAMS